MDNYNAVYAVLRAAIWGTDRYPFIPNGDEDWKSVYKELADQAVAPLAADVLVGSGVCTPELRQKILLGTMKRIGFFNRLMKQQEELKHILDDANIPFVVLKGAAAAVYYPQPELRTMGDVDLIVLPADFDRAAQLMLDNGYEVEDLTYDKHNEYRKNGIKFELHRYFSQIDDATAAKNFDEIIFDRIPKAEIREVGNFRVPMLPDTENGLVLLTHIAQHMERGGLGLRQIIDWMCFADRVLDERKWVEEFEPAAKSYGLYTLAITITRMCQLYLGLRSDQLGWCADAEDDLCHETMSMIMARGNFGRKIGKSSQTIQAIYEMGDIFQMPKHLQKRGEANWKLLKRYPFLKPFAWLYQIFRYIAKGFARENALQQFAEDVENHRKDASLLSRLGIGHRQNSENK